MKPETVLLLRKLAREATIFALLGMVVAAIGVFVYMDNEDRTNAKQKAETAVHAGIDLSAGLEPPVKPAPTVQVPLTNGTILHVRACQPQIEPRNFDQLANDKDFLAATQSDQVKYLSYFDPDFAKSSSKDQLGYLAYLTHKTGKDPQSTTPTVIFDEFADQQKDCRRFSTDPLAIRVSVPAGNADQLAIEKDYWTAYKEARYHDPSGGTLFGTLYVGLLGFPAGLVLWIFYRLVRFAVKG